MVNIKEPVQARAAAYCAIYPVLSQIAKDHGYALCVHGSIHRDLDLVAVPWIEEASDELTLITAFKECIGAVFTHEDFDHNIPDGDPKIKPHGRKAYSLHLTNKGMYGGYLDISVMTRCPRKDDSHA